MGGGVVRNRFRQARYDKLKAALTVQRAKQPHLMKCDPDTDPEVAKSGTESAASESRMLPGENDGNPEFSDNDSSSNEAEHAPSARELELI